MPAITATSGDIVVGLHSAANEQFYAQSWLFKANNLSDVASALTSFNNISPLTTTGDLLYFNGTNNARLAIGSSNYILAVSGGAPAWIANPGLLAANNLSDLASLSTALTNLGLSSSSNVTFATLTTTGLNKLSNANALTAYAGGGQSSALALTHAINRVTTVATAADSVKLPTSAAGLTCVVINAAASNALDCYPVSGDAINALSANAALSIAANTTVIFFCAVAGTWNSVVTA